MNSERTKRPLNVGVIGLGVGEQHARTYHQLPNCHLKWLFDLDVNKANHLKDSLEGARVAENLDTLLQDPEIDIVSIASFDDAHFEQVISALENKKNVFVEKPLCRNHDEAAKIKAIWEEAGSPVVDSNLVLRSAPIYIWLREQIRNGALGDIYAFDGEYLYGRLHKITEGWRKDVLDYSVMMGGGVHLVDLMVWLTGKTPHSVSSVGNNICTRDTPFRQNDFMASTFQFKEGLIGRIAANFGCVHKHHHIIRIFGTEGTFIYDDQGPRVHKSRSEEEPPQFIDLPTLPSGKGDLIPDFVATINGEREGSVSLQHNLNIISIAASADAALSSNQELMINYV